VKIVKISDAKNNLSRHLEYVKRGGRIRIVDRSVPVAELVPIGPEMRDDDEALADALRRGVARPPETRAALPKSFFFASKKTRRAPSVSDALIRDRREGR